MPRDRCVLVSGETSAEAEEKIKMNTTTSKVEEVPVTVKPSWESKKWWAAIVAAVSAGLAVYLADGPLQADPETIAKGVSMVAGVLGAYFVSRSKSITPTGEKKAIRENSDAVVAKTTL
jgi:hypothetical protein